jgi:UDP-N-acetylglucosamine:LPS N-acetylglucosamine transferase
LKFLEDAELAQVGVVLGRGGHTAETLALLDLLGKQYSYIYFIGLLDSLTPMKIRIPGKVFPVLVPRLLPQDSRIMSTIRTLATLMLSFIYMLMFRPSVAVSCGTGMTVPIFYSAKFLGIKTVFIESITQIESLSITGRMLLGKTDLFYVQWPKLAEKTPGGLYGGQLL